MTKEIDDKTLAAREELAGHYKQILGLLGEDAEREGLIKTPERVAKAMQFLTKGYNEDPAKVLASAMFQEEDYKQMVIVTSYASVLRKGPCRLYPQEIYNGSEQDSPGSGYLCPPPANPGTPDYADQRLHPANVGPSGCHGGDRSTTHVHADARCGETEFPDDNFRLYRFLPAG